MRQLPFNVPLLLSTLAAGVLLNACGGGSATPPGTVSGSSGFVIDDYLNGATVICDSNNNGTADSGESTKLTDSSGFFKFDTACGATIVATGGTNVDTGLPFTGKLKAPQGSTVVTPLTTLVAAGMSIDQVNTALGILSGTDLLNTDPARRLAGALANGELMKKSLAVQQLVQKTTEMLAGLASSGGTAAQPAIYGEVIAALASTLQNGSALNTSTTLDQSVISAFVKAATQRVAASTALSAEVRDGALSVNADSLAQVVAGALKVQAEAILKASDTGVTAATLIAQSDAQITNFVGTNKVQLALAPSGSTATLGSDLSGQVASSLTGGGSTPPPPTSSGTVLVTFDENTPAFTGMGAYGGALPTVEAGPSGGSGNALRILKPVAPDTWGGVFFNVAAIPFAADRKTITARVNATRAGAVIKLKVESANGGPAIEVASTPTGAANTWQTLTWDFAGVDVSKSYTVFAVTPDQDLVTTGQSYYIDDITLAAATVVVVAPPTTAALVSFDEVNPAFTGMGAYGGALPTVEAGPSGGSGNALRILKPVAPDTWGGVFFNVAAIPFAADRKTITARVNATRAGAVIKFKVESANGGPAIEVASSPTGAANTWQTLSWNLSGVDVSKSYTVIAITPDQDLVTTGQSYYIDDITLAAATGGGGGGSPTIVFDPNAAMGSNGPQSITVTGADIKTPNGGLTFFSAGEAIFAADYLGSAEAFAPFNLAAYPAARTVSYPGVGNLANGSIGYYQDDATLSNSANKIEEGGYVVGSVLDANGAPNFFRYFIMKGPAVPNSYMGLFVNAPNNGTVDISGFSKIKFRLWGPRSMYELSFHPQGLEVILAGPKVNGCNTGSGGTEIVQTFNATQTIGAASQYKLPLSGFTVKGLCAGDTNATAVASVLTRLARVVVNVPGTAFNFTLAEPNTNPAMYAIGLNLSAIGFTNIP